MGLLGQIVAMIMVAKRLGPRNVLHNVSQTNEVLRFQLMIIQGAKHRSSLNSPAENLDQVTDTFQALLQAVGSIDCMFVLSRIAGPYLDAFCYHIIVVFIPKVEAFGQYVVRQILSPYIFQALLPPKLIKACLTRAPVGKQIGHQGLLLVATRQENVVHARQQSLAKYLWSPSHDMRMSAAVCFNAKNAR